MTSKRKKPLWRRAFLRALRGTGNVRVAAEAAGVDHSTVYLARKGDVRFAGKWAVAVAEGKALVAAGAEEAPPPRCTRSPSPGNPGEELVLRVSKNAGAQLVRAGPGHWSVRKEALFLAALKKTGCVRAAVAATGLSTTAIYNRRRNYRGFAADWDVALAAARARMPELLTAATLAALDPEIQDSELPPVNVDQAIRICARWGGGGSAAAPAFVQPPIEEVRASILAKLEAIEAHGRRERAGS